MAVRDRAGGAAGVRPPVDRLGAVRKVAAQADLIYHPPGVIGLVQATIDEIAERESRDVVRNIQVLDEIASTPAPIKTTI